MKFYFAILLLLSFERLDAQQSSHKAVKGGTFNYNLRATPELLNPLSAKDYYSRVVNSFMVESLATRNMDTYEWEPKLATSWKISLDGMTFAFELRKGVRWHDGKEMTAKDVKFTFDALTDPKNRYGSAHFKPYYDAIEEANVQNPYKIQFIARRRYFGNFNVLASMRILPEHIYGDTSKGKRPQVKQEDMGFGAV